MKETKLPTIGLAFLAIICILSCRQTAEPAFQNASTTAQAHHSHLLAFNLP